ncbi:MAG TPA: hypothetical protein VIL01_01830 [Thermomicrobiales bacterium]
MKALRDLIRPFRQVTSQFDRYYGRVVGAGPGYPTADEARRDLRNFDQTVNIWRWTI